MQCLSHTRRTQEAQQIEELSGTKVPAISKHLKNIFASGELIEEVVISKMETTTKHGAMTGKTQTKETNFYNLDAILSVGYRVNSKNAHTKPFLRRTQGYHEHPWPLL